MTTLQALDMLWSERGKVIIGFSPEKNADVIPGDELRSFMGHAIPDMNLLVMERAQFDDWNDQATFLGIRNPHVPKSGQKFFSCILVKRWTHSGNRRVPTLMHPDRRSDKT